MKMFAVAGLVMISTQVTLAAINVRSMTCEVESPGERKTCCKKTGQMDDRGQIDIDFREANDFDLAYWGATFVSKDRNSSDELILTIKHGPSGAAGSANFLQPQTTNNITGKTSVSTEKRDGNFGVYYVLECHLN